MALFVTSICPLLVNNKVLCDGGGDKQKQNPSNSLQSGKKFLLPIFQIGKGIFTWFFSKLFQKGLKCGVSKRTAR